MTRIVLKGPFGPQECVLDTFDFEYQDDNFVFFIPPKPLHYFGYITQ